MNPDLMRSDPNAFYGGALAVESYDLFAGADIRMADDVDFYLELARARAGAVLELGAGTGRVLAPLARDGFSVTGVDVSQPMLDIAARRLVSEGLSARLVCAAMQDLDLGETYDLVLIPARAFQHLVEPSDQRRALERVHAHLKPGAMLCLDLFDPLLEVCVGAPALSPPREATDPATGRRFRRICLARAADPFRQIVSERLRIELLDPEGRVLAAEETSWRLRWSLRQEMAYLLELCGFEALEVYSDFKRSPPAYGREQVWLALRP